MYSEIVELYRHFAAVVMIGLWFAGHVKLLLDARPKETGRVVLLDGKPVKW